MARWHIVAVAIGAVVAASVWRDYSISRERAQAEQALAEYRAQHAREVAQDAEREQQSCARDLPQRKAAFEEAFKRGAYSDAAAAVRACARLLDSAELRALLFRAEGAMTLATATNPSLAAPQRLMAFDQLQATFPDLYRGQERAHKALEAQQRREQARERGQRGVSIGMTAGEVMQSSWGRPERINRDTYSWGVREQWVYPRGYLYFRDGVLESVSQTD